MQHDLIIPQTMVFPQCSRQGIASLSVTKPVFLRVPAVYPSASSALCSRSVPARASPASPLRSQCFPVLPQCSRQLPQPLPASTASFSRLFVITMPVIPQCSRQLPQLLSASFRSQLPLLAPPLRSQRSRSVPASLSSLSVTKPVFPQCSCQLPQPRNSCVAFARRCRRRIEELQQSDKVVPALQAKLGKFRNTNSFSAFVAWQAIVLASFGMQCGV
jgi:hypothetical protein